MDRSYNELLSLSMPAPPWPPAPSTSHQSITWTAPLPQPQPERHAQTSPYHAELTGMQFSMADAINAPHSEASLSPSSNTNSPFHYTSLESNYLGTPSHTHDINQYTHPTAAHSQAMPIGMTPQNHLYAQFAHDPLSSPEDNLLQSLHRRQHSSTASPASLPSDVSQQSSSRRPYRRMLRRQNTSSSMSSNSSYQSNAPGTETRGPPMTPTTSRSRSSTGSHQLMTATRRQSGTLSANSSEMRAKLSSSSSSGTMDKIQESSAMTFTTGITTSLSAELAGLGLNVADFSMVHENDGSIEMQRKDSSSSSSTTRTRRATTQEQTESSFLSQATSSLDSSGIDDSLLSLKSNGPYNSRWIHGKDTPPSSPAPSFGPRTGPSPFFDQRLGKMSASAASRFSPSSPYSRHDEFGVVQGKAAGTSSLDWSSTWPRISMSQADSSHGVTNEASPLSDTRRSRFVQSTRSLHESRSKRHSRGFSSALSLEAIYDGGASGSRIMRGSNESLQSDIGPSRSSRPVTEINESRRMKRMSASFVSEQEARRLHHEKQRQYDQVSDALDTLRRFLRQRDDDPTSSSSRPTSYAGGGPGVATLGEQVSSMLAESSQQSRHAASSRRQRTLRHPPTGPLPPRGSVFVSPQATSPNLALPGQDRLRVEAERIAALEDLAKRVRQMKEENQQMLDDL